MRFSLSLFLPLLLLSPCSSFIPTFTSSRITPPSSLSAVSKPGDSAFVLGIGFQQWMVSKELIRSGLKPVLMADVAKADGMRQNWTPPPAEIVTNGQSEWEPSASLCTSLLITPEASDIPGQTLTSLLSQMPLCTRVVLLNPAGVTKGKGVEEKDDNWILNRMMILGGKRVGAAGDDLEKAKSCEDAILKAKSDGVIDEAIIIYRGILKGGGGDDGLGDLYYKVCGSEPEEIVERTYDNARKGLRIIHGDSIDTTLKVKEKGDTDDVTMKNLKEEIKNKTSRLSLARVIVQTLFVEDVEDRMSVLCDFGEEIVSVEDCTTMIENLKQHAL